MRPHAPLPANTPEERLKRILDIIDSAKIQIHCTECMDWQALTDRIYRVARTGTDDAG